MRKVQTPWKLARPLEEALRGTSLTNSELASAAKVNYHAVRRMRRDGVMNRSSNAVALCKFFRISEPAATEGLSKTSLGSAVAAAWDGTEEQGRLILDLVKWIAQYNVTPKAAGE
jgi:hypothetical protein